MSALRAALVAGEESGGPEQFDFDAYIASKRARTSRDDSDRADQSLGDLGPTRHRCAMVLVPSRPCMV